MSWFAHRETGEAVEVPDQVYETYLDLVRFALEAQALEDHHRAAAKVEQGKAQQAATDAHRYLQQAAELVPRDIAIPVGDAVTHRAPGRAQPRSVKRDGIEAHAELLPSSCLPRDVTTTRWPTVADIDAARPAIDHAGIPITDLLDIPAPPADVVRVDYPKEAR